MTLLLAAAVGVMFGSGAYLLMAADLLRVVVGVVLVSNAASLAVMAASLERGQPPVAPLGRGEPVSDPLVQAMTLTALVIGVSLIALLLVVALRIQRERGTVRLEEVRPEEERDDEEGA